MDLAIAVTVLTVVVLSIASLLGGLGCSIANGHWSTWHAAAWLMVAIVGLPVFLLTALLYVGLAAALVMFWLSASLARWERAAQFVAIVSALGAGIAFATENAEPLEAAAFGASAACAVLAIAKLGRSFGQDTIWEARSPRRSPAKT